MSNFPNPPRYRTRPTHPRFILGHSLEQIQKLARIQGTREPVEYNTYAREHGLSVVADGASQTVEQRQAAMEKDAEFFRERYDVVLYHVITPADYNHDRIRMVQGVPAGPSLRMPWAERSNFLVPQFWLIGTDGIATNLRAHNEQSDQWGGKIDLSDYLFDVELLRAGVPTVLTGRVYDRDSVDEIVNDPTFQQRIREGLVLGTLGGPFAGNHHDRPVDLNTINLHNVAFRVLSVELKDGVATGSVKFVGPMASAARDLTYGKDYVFGMRSIVVKKFQEGAESNRVQGIITWDMVNAPKG